MTKQSKFALLLKTLLTRTRKILEWKVKAIACHTLVIRSRNSNSKHRRRFLNFLLFAISEYSQYTHRY